MVRKSCSVVWALTIAIFFGSFLTLSHATPFEDPAMESKAHEVFMDVMSPFCPGRSLNDCPSSKAHELKDEIRSEIEGGKKKEEILEKIFSKYGDQYRAIPKTEGFGLLAWGLPCAFLAVGLGVLLIVGLRSKPQSGATDDDDTQE